jgi:ABC-type lipoprotein release transport system permease subunit
MPYSIQLNDIIFIISISLVSSLLASYIPILRIFKIKPNLVLR